MGFKMHNTPFGLVGLYFTISPNVQKQDMVQKKQRESPKSFTKPPSPFPSERKCDWTWSQNQSASVRGTAWGKRIDLKFDHTVPV